MEPGWRVGDVHPREEKVVGRAHSTLQGLQGPQRRKKNSGPGAGVAG